MPEIIRARDCIVFHKGDSITVAVDEAMAAGGWPGGQGVKWADSPLDELLVTYADGRFAGILIWGSDESADRFVSMTRSQPHYRYATMIFGDTIFSTTSYERYTYASRIAGPPYVPLVYAPHDRLYLSLRGLWTNEDEAGLAALPHAPLSPWGKLAQVPKPGNNHFLGVHI